MSEAAEEVLVKISGVVLDPDSKIPIIILRDSLGEQILPIWIGSFEANAIATCLEGVESPRPMTHDFLLQAIEVLRGELERVVITDLLGDTFLAAVHLTSQGVSLELDARPSDALALAVRADVPVFVRRVVFEKVKTSVRTDRLSEQDRLKNWLEEVDPDELGKYTM